MDAIVWIWAVTLVLALVLTLPLLAIAFRFVHHAREIDRLARKTLAAAGGVAGNTANIVMLETLLAHATALAETSNAIDGVAARIHGHAASVVRGLSAKA
jgi:hypothetical protein